MDFYEIRSLSRPVAKVVFSDYEMQLIWAVTSTAKDKWPFALNDSLSMQHIVEALRSIQE